MLRNSLWLCGIALLGCVLGGCPQPNPSETETREVRVTADNPSETTDDRAELGCPEGAIAVVGDRVISREDADRRARITMRQQGLTPADEDYEALKRRAQQGAVDFLIKAYVLQDLAAEADLQVPTQEVEAELLSWKMRVPSQAAWDDFLAENSMTEEEFAASLELDLRIRMLLEDAAVTGVPTPTLEEAENFYEVNNYVFAYPERVRYEEIHWPVAADVPEASRDAALAAMTALSEECQKEPNRFTEICDTVKSATWGYVGIRHKYYNMDNLEKVVQDTVELLDIDEISEPIETQTGFSILRIVSLRQTFQSAREEILQSILEDRARQNLEQWLERQRKEHRIRICDLAYYQGTDEGGSTTGTGE